MQGLILMLWGHYSRNLTEVERTRPERTMSGVVGLSESSVPGFGGVVRGESDRNEFLWGPFALFVVRNSTKLVRNLAKY